MAVEAGKLQYLEQSHGGDSGRVGAGAATKHQGTDFAGPCRWKRGLDPQGVVVTYCIPRNFG